MADISSTGQVIHDDISVLMPLLHSVTARWDQFGCHLPIAYEDIQNIKKGGHHTETKAKMIDVLYHYKRKNGAKKWEDIVKALQDMRNYGLASCIPQTGPVPVDSDDYINLMLETHQLKRVTSEWRSFGLQLGVPYHELRDIDKGKITPRECLVEVLSVWIDKKGEKAKVSSIINACKSIGDHSLAETLEQNSDIKRIMSRTFDQPIQCAEDRNIQYGLHNKQPSKYALNYNEGTNGIGVNVMNTTEWSQKTTQAKVGQATFVTSDGTKDVLKSHKTQLKKTILSGGLTTIVHLCEEVDVITESVKRKLLSSMTGQTEEDRAYMLIDSIRDSCSVKVLDNFLVILHKHCGQSGQDVSIEIAKEFDGPLETFQSLLEKAKPKPKGQSQHKVGDNVEETVDSNHGNSSSNLFVPDPKKILDKSPTLEDVMDIIKDNDDSHKFRDALKAPIDTDLRSAMDHWIKEEPTNVTWRNFIGALKDSSKTETARFILNNYLRQLSVYEKYIGLPDYVSFEELGI